MAIKLYQSQVSMFCEKVRIVFALKKVPYEIVDVRKDDRKSLIEYTGQRKVPSTNYNGEMVIDSTVISARLDKDQPNPGIYPEAPAQKESVSGAGRLVGRSVNSCESCDAAR